MQTTALALPHPACPLCGRPNGCAPAACGSFAVDCWCSAQRFGPEILARARSADALACICRRCAEDAAGVPARPAPSEA